MSEKFDWDDGCRVVPFQPEQNETAVYTNGYGNIVLRQKEPHAWKDDEDHFVIFRPEHAEAIVRAIIEEVGLPLVLIAEPSESSCATVRKLKDVTAAARQRRRREKLRKDRDTSRDECPDVAGVTAAQPAIPSDRAQLVLLHSPAAESEESRQRR